ncbi:MAG: hypothetical protein DMG30_09120 [Acidobacteria bacterium]|nr:MAG: hypothetical protein DMG30_09120 [Acidobacteriota bacterium]
MWLKRFDRQSGKLTFPSRSSALGRGTFGFIFSETCKMKAVEQINQRWIGYDFPMPTLLIASKLPAHTVIASDMAIASFTTVKTSRAS